MAKSDLHVHTKYSEHSSEWFLQRIGAGESYTDPETVYRTAKQAGMDFVTVTDHNRIEGSLRICEKHPNDTFTGVEATTYFPEDGCKIHTLIYGLSAEEFDEIEKLRRDIYQLRDYLSERGLPHSIAHATYSVNGKLALKHLEKLILLFNVFEERNGGRNRLNNHSWERVLKSLTETDIDRLKRKYGIQPVGDAPWKKGFTGGSDDHAGLFIGQTYTITDAETPTDFLRAIQRLEGKSEGRSNDYRSLVFSIYKVAYDFSLSNGGFSRPIFKQLNQAIFENSSVPFSSKWKMNGLLFLSRLKDSSGQEAMWLRNIKELLDKVQRDIPVSEKLDVLVDGITSLGDELLADLFQSIERDAQKGDLERLTGRLITTLPAVFMAVPFLTSYNHMHKSRKVIDELNSAFQIRKPSRKVLLFTDTLTNLNGVAMTLQAIGNKAFQTGKSLRIATTLSEEERDSGQFPYVIDIPSVYQFSLPYYSSYKIQIPSLMRAIQIIDKYDPEEIYISTPGPLGLLGLLIGKLSKIPVTGIFHTDFTLQINDIIGDDSLHNASEYYTRWFYSLCDTIQVPTAEYIDIMAERGLPRERMKLFRRGIDIDLFKPDTSAAMGVAEKYHLTTGIRLLYAGRVSRDKNLDFLLEVVRGIQKKFPDTNLIIAGDGPYLSHLRELATNYTNIFFTGKLNQKDLAELYAGSDLFLLTSNTDTFGMVVYEAQSCGLPPIVSDIGGPQELVEHGSNGFLAKASDFDEWVTVVTKAIEIMQNEPDRFNKIKIAARSSASTDSDWEHLIEEMVGSVPDTTHILDRIIRSNNTIPSNTVTEYSSMSN